MNAKTLKALKGSIRKWEKIVAGMGGDRGPANCALCEMFLHEHACRGCPVYSRTGQEGCRGTPYDDWKGRRHPHGQNEVFATTPHYKSAARAEVRFLKSLLPKATPERKVKR
jgi:hypothetical protein